MIHIKTGVDFRVMQTQLVFGIHVAVNALRDLDVTKDFWITSICDDAPGRLANSLHKSGLAVDIKCPFDTSDMNKRYVQILNTILGPQFQIIFEGPGTPNSTGQHIHMEFDVKAYASDLVKKS